MVIIRTYNKNRLFNEAVFVQNLAQIIDFLQTVI